MQVFTIFANNRLRNNQYIIQTDKTVCIDPYDGEQICTFLAGEKIQVHIDSLSLINTHQHHDHIRGNADILRLGARLIENKTLVSKPLELSSQYELRALFTPGHTMDSYSYLVFDKSQNLYSQAFLGDTLFHLGVGNCYNGGNVQILAETLIKLDQVLSKETLLNIGHDYFESNLNFTMMYFDLPKSFIKDPLGQIQYMNWGEQKRLNPFLRVLFDADFRKKYYDQQEPVEAFTSMRELRDKF